jgi:SAM-dependent methyltransferase
MFTELKFHCRALLGRAYHRFTDRSLRANAIHAYYAKREDNEEQVQREVDFAIACGNEYANNIARELGRPIEPIPDLSSLAVLELGPGINFGGILICAMLGASVAVFDKYLVDWNEGYHPRFYRLLRERMKASDLGFDVAILDTIISEGGHSPQVIQAKRGEFDLGKIDFADSSFDAVMSNAALEHVANVPRLCAELLRVTRSGGVGIHQVDFRDHSNNDRPLEFLATPDHEYAQKFLEAQGGGGNRVRHHELIDEFKSVGFQLIRFEPNCYADEAYVQQIRPKLLPRYASMTVEDLRVVGGRLFLCIPKNAAGCSESTGS